MIYLCIQKDLPLPIFSRQLTDELSKCGCQAAVVRLGFGSLLRFERRFLPALHSAVVFLNLRVGASRFISRLRAEDVVVLYETFGLVSRWGDGWFHRAVKAHGTKLVCLMQDAWPFVKGSPLHQRAFDLHAELSDLVAGVTPELVALLGKTHPEKAPVLMEEAVDVDSFRPDFGRNDPTIVWSGPPSKLVEVLSLVPVLERVFAQHPFRLSLVSGRKRPKIGRTNFPIDWIPFRGTSRKEQFRCASIAFAQYKNDAYGRCKGNYKIKTYLAAGCAVVSNPVGYNRELIRPGVNGLFAATPEEWEAAFLRLLKNPDERLAMRKASRELAARRFSYDAIAKQYATVLKKFLG